MRAHGSLLQLLHPTGAPAGVRVLGSALPDELRPAVDTDAPDVLVLAPGRGDTDDAGLRGMGAASRDVIARGGLVLVAGGATTRRRLAPVLEGLSVPPRRLLVLPSGVLVTADRPALRRALARAASPLRAGVAPLASAWPGALGFVARAALTAYCGTGAGLCGWLPGDPAADGALVLVPSWRGAGGSVVVTRLTAGGSLVAKVGTGPESADVGHREAQALELLGASARVAGVDVPSVVDVVDVAGRPAAVLTGLPGAPAALAPRTARATAHALARWLERWTIATRSDGDAARVLDASLLEPLALLEAELPAAYVERVRRTVAGLARGTTPLAASHGDLTLWNVLASPSGVGVVDWEGAVERSLPLVDLPYLLVDAVGLRTRSREAAYEECFAPGGAARDWARGIVDEVARGVGLDEDWLELACDACWLGHAADERRRGVAATPFLGVLRRHAAREA